EARGLLEPERTEGGTRRYSANDLDRLRRIGELLDAGVNLAGIAMVMDLQDENTQLRAEKQDAEKEEQQWLPTAPVKAAPIPASRSPKRTSSSSRSRPTRR
ncbi:MAG TPA: MerR family transcriptional regulator, partial [Jatrophihabitans sp.]